jgi:hypothetical protein
MEEIYLPKEYMIFFRESGYTPPISKYNQPPYDEWVQYRNSKWPKTEWKQKSSAEYNTLVRI